jgi:hypothetical protein
MGDRASSRIDGGLDPVSIEAAAEAQCPTGVKPAAPWRLSALSILPDYRLAVTFHDGATGVVDLSAVTSGSELGIYEPFKDPWYFAQACIEPGAVTWPNGADRNPAWMNDQLRWSKACCFPLKSLSQTRRMHQTLPGSLLE